jgi:hypothetical protein
MGGATSQAVSRRPTAAKARVQTKVCETCGGQSGFVGGFPLSVLFRHCPILIVSYMLLLPVGQTGEAWEPSRKPCCFVNRGARTFSW